MNFSNKRFFAGNRNLPKIYIIILSGVVSLCAYYALFFISSATSYTYEDEMYDAARIMENAIITLRNYCMQEGIEIDTTVDPNRTTLIGPEFSKLTTTLGHLEAKRSTTNPAFAGLIVHLLHKAGVNEGDTVAVGSSGSFPGLLVATLSAAQSMGVYPMTIISLGASSFGGTKINFNLLDIYRVLLESSIFKVPLAAISLGGSKDIGENFEPEVKNRLIEQIETSGIPFIHEKDLRKNVSLRMNVYEGEASQRRISAFVNTGGSYANMGTNSLVLEVKPGLNRKMHIPSGEQRGVIFEMAARKVPVIHLLFIKGLVLNYGLRWDPIPLPHAETLDFKSYQYSHVSGFWLITGVYFGLMISLFVAYIGLKNKNT